MDKLRINVNEAKEKLKTVNDKLKRRNNAVIYNLPENSKDKDKEMVLKLVKEITGQDLGGVLKDLFGMGKKQMKFRMLDQYLSNWKF